VSYDVSFTIKAGGPEPFELATRNYTSNTSAMWRRALAATGWWDGSLAELIESTDDTAFIGRVVARAAELMRQAGEDAYADLSPSNGWGDYDGALAYLEWIAQHCAALPLATVEVSR